MPAKPPFSARDIVEHLIQSEVRKPLHEAQNDMRFDVGCRVEVWVTGDEIREDPRAQQIVNGGTGDIEGKIQMLKNLAQTIAAEKLNTAGDGVHISCDSLALSNVNLDRIDWNDLALGDAERGAAEL